MGRWCPMKRLQCPFGTTKIRVRQGNRCALKISTARAFSTTALAARRMLHSFPPHPGILQLPENSEENKWAVKEILCVLVGIVGRRVEFMYEDTRIAAQSP